MNVDELVEGLFLSEEKNRFLCRVLVCGEIIECYVPSSSRLDNYINLKNKRVLLTINKGKNARTKYSLFAVKHYNKYIMLNLNIINKAYEQFVNGDFFTQSDSNLLCREKTIDGYKADFVIEGDNKIIIENKGIISVNREAVFPTVYSQRAIEQLGVIYKLLCEKHIVIYNFISLSPFVKTIKINEDQHEFYEKFCNCIEQGMKVYGLRFDYSDKQIKCKTINVNI